MKRAGGAALMLVLCCPSPGARAQGSPPSFCAQLNQVYNLRTRAFRPLRGPYDEDKQAFDANLLLPGAQRCLIDEDEYAFKYSCTWKYGAEDAGAAIKDAKSLYRASAQCLYPSFNPMIPDLPPRRLDAESTILAEYPIPDRDRHSTLKVWVAREAASKYIPEEVTLYFDMRYAVK